MIGRSHCDLYLCLGSYSIQLRPWGYRRFSKYSASLIIRHPMNNNEIISLKNFGMLRSCDVAELLVTTDTSSEATESEVKHVKITGGSIARIPYSCH